MRLSKKTGWPVLFFLVIVLGSCGGGGFPEDTEAVEQTDSKLESIEQYYNVRTAVVARNEISSFLDLSGDVEASVSLDVHPDTAGKLVRILVKPGDYVQQDQVLAQVDPGRPGMVYAVSPVQSPISGTITAVNVDPGATVSSQVPIFRVGRLDSLVVTTQVPERFLYMISMGQKALISSTAFPDNQFSATVSSVSPVVNPVSRTMEVKLTLREPTSVKSGMFVGIRLITSTDKNALIIPEKALISRSTETYVYRVSGNTAEKVIVTTGLTCEGAVEILTGLLEGDQVVIQGANLLSDGSKIKVLTATSTTNSQEKRS